MKYMYYCERCRTTFEAEVEPPEEGGFPEKPCPKCEYPHSVAAFPAEIVKPEGGCKPSSGC